MLLKLLAPLRIDFAIVSERLHQNAANYAQFWDNVHEQVHKLHQHLPQSSNFSQTLHEIRFAHCSIHHQVFDGGSQYRTLDSDSLPRPLHVMEVHLTSQHIAYTPTEEAQKDLLQHLERMVIRIYDHHVALIEMTFALGDQLQQIDAENVANDVHDLEQASILLGEDVIEWCHESILKVIFDWMNHVPDAEIYVDSTPSFVIKARVMWVTRTLIFEPDEPRNRDGIIHQWLLNSGGTEVVDGKTYIEHLQQDATRHLAHWLNYLFREEAYATIQPQSDSADALAKPFSDKWKALIHAQYYYAALDIVDLHLTTILANAWAPAPDVKIDSLKYLLEYNIRNANLLLIQHHDNAKYYRRTVKSELDKILAYWQYEEVLVQPVQDKIDLCESRLQLLMQQEAAKSGVFTDMILLGIGVTGIFSTFLGLAEFGRTMANDVNLAAYDVNSPNLIEWLAVQPTDVILVLSLMLSIVLAILYLFFRQQQTVS